MADRDKVIKGLECCSQMVGECCRECPYADECEEGEGLLAGSAHLAADALSLLKAQEQDSKKIIEKGNVYECPWCGEEVFSDTNPNYCGYCGQAVKWDV